MENRFSPHNWLPLFLPCPRLTSCFYLLFVEQGFFTPLFTFSSLCLFIFIVPRENKRNVHSTQAFFGPSSGSKCHWPSVWPTIPICSLGLFLSHRACSHQQRERFAPLCVILTNRRWINISQPLYGELIIGAARCYRKESFPSQEKQILHHQIEYILIFPVR